MTSADVCSGVCLVSVFPFLWITVFDDRQKQLSTGWSELCFLKN